MSKGQDGDEPIFIRSNWGTSRYVYNPRNPVGAGLIIGSLLFAAIFMYSLHASSSWSEGELRDAVNVAVRDLEASPQTLGAWTGDYDSMIRDALEKSGKGPSTGGLRVEDADDPYDKDADPAVDLFEVTAEDVDTTFCLSVSPPEPEPRMTSVEVSLSIAVEEGGC
ncbi:hypothetical protein AB0P10_01750 [Streptomyces parvus]|uniref:hypothetical protein n=1 Tax=Streptomyces TaxID=1883 RepID=UPI000D5138F8|nr:hypothetical protein [Streptomyces sp. CS131]PVC80000.1 hypothetical protein DBP20_31990 [Streptomyces sp. CS131]